MFIIYEYAACLFTVLFCASLLFAASVVFLVIIEGGSILTRMLRKRGAGALLLQGRRVAAESRDS
jgi:hypothetical protein